MNALLPLLLLAAPLAGALWIVAFARRPNLREAGSLLAAGVMAVVAGLIVTRVAAGDSVEVVLLDLVPGAPLHLRADGLGAFFAFMASGLWAITTVYSIGYMRGAREHAQTRYYFWFAVCLLAVAGLTLSANLVTFFVFYELLTVATYPLVVHKQSAEAIRAGRKYLAYALTAGLLLLAAIIWTHELAGEFALRPGGILPPDIPRGSLWALFGLFIGGVAVKAGVMPLHSWLPSAMVAPTPVSALLHAVAVVKAGVFGVARVVGWVFGPTLLADLGGAEVLAWFAASTIVLSSLIALLQDNLKRRLAFSTIGQLSYCVLGLALLTPEAMAGGMFHMLGHGLMKITLFFCAGAIYVTTKKTRVSQLDGIGRQMPYTMIAFGVAAVGLAGFPPLVGFTAKWFLLEGTTATGHTAFSVALVLSGVLNIAYLFPIVLRAFFRSSPDHAERADARPALLAPLLVTAALTIVIGLAPDALLPLWSLVAEAAAEVTR
ncbi:MAG: proton-conducting transporter membrane subunit [Myxococcota bacterium]